MDWNAAIEKNREALKRVLAMLVAMAGLDGGRPATLPRHLHRAVLSLLRPAEAAARRLIIVAARGIVVALPPASPRKPRPTSTILRNGIGTGIVMPRGFRPSAGPQPRRRARLALPLFDPLPRWNARKRPAASGFPRISIPGLTQPFPVPRAPSPDDPIDAARLALRLGALGRALDDLPREARRFARWKARRDRAACGGPHSPCHAAAPRPSARRAPVALRSGRVGRPEEHPRCRRDPGARPRAGQLRAQPRHVMTPAAAFAEREEGGGINSQTAKAGVAMMKRDFPPARGRSWPNRPALPLSPSSR